MLDFAKVKAEHPIEQVAERLGLKMKKAGSTLRGPCPSGQGDDRALVITPTKGVFFSFATQKGGDCISLVAFVRGTSLKEAAAWIAGNQAPEPEKSTISQPKTEGLKELDYLQPEHEAVMAVGFPEDVAKAAGIGYAPRGMMRGKVAIPVRLPNGRLIGYCGVEDATLPSDWKL